MLTLSMAKDLSVTVHQLVDLLTVKMLSFGL